ncbi:MAG: T9SS type A sorting domain-containing protein [Calditrichaeota bacterium]|nr:T9SS type A sorting domain-containing protein [Calditrichota bacterium]
MYPKPRHIAFLPILLILFLCINSTQAEIIEESGSLLEFFAGIEDGCDYDNWVSHISEGIASEGYNDYAPVEHDRQMTGFGTYVVIDSLENPNAYLTTWYEIVSNIVAGDLNVAAGILDTSVLADIYDFVLLEDGDNRYVILREEISYEYFDHNGTEEPEDDVSGSFEYGWGLYIFNLQPETPNIIIEAPHPCDDFITTYIGIDAFLNLGAYAMFVSGAGREVSWEGEGAYYNGAAISDPTRNARTLFHEAHKCVVDLINSEYVMQIHSYDTRNRVLRPNLLSTYPDNRADAPLYDAETNFDILHLTPRVPIQANTIGAANHDSVRIDNYYAIWHSGDSVYYNHEYYIPRTMNDLQGWDSPQRHYSLNNQEPGVHENWLHIEHDELPNVINEDVLGFYPSGGVPTYATYMNAVEFNRPLYTAIYDYFHTRRLHTIPDDFQTIQAGIDAAYGGDTILVHPGEYVENLRFNGKNLVVASLFLTTNNPAYIDATIIDGGRNGSVVRFSNGENYRAQLTGFTIRNGQHDDGGGIYCRDANPTVDNCLITGNGANINGAAVFCESGGITLTNCTITGNTSNEGGGALYCWRGANVKLTNSILWDNQPQEIYVLERGDPDTIIFAYCDVEGAPGGIINRHNVAITWDDNSIDQNPEFADPNVGNFHLSANSPCINTGNPEYPLDPDSSRIDMGAFSFFHRNLIVAPWVLEFGNIDIGTVDSLMVTVSNRGETPILLTNLEITPEGSPFEIVTDINNIEIEPGADQIVWVRFERAEAGAFDAVLRIESNERGEDALNVILHGGQLGIDPYEEPQPRDFRIISFYPNPFNSSGMLVYQITETSQVDISLFNISGRKVADISNQTRHEGTYLQPINANSLPTGLYFAQVRAGDLVQTRKILVYR